jgi:ABC-type transporter Mla MlaB component
MEKMKSTKKRKPLRRVVGKTVATASTKSAAAAKTRPDANASLDGSASPDANTRPNASMQPDANADGNASAVEGTAVEASVNTKFHLEPSLEIKDVEDVHKRLMARLARGAAVTVDVSRVGAVDTAGVQLLVAFQGEAVKQGVSVEFCGNSTALTHALTVLGLGAVVRIASAHD